MEWKWIIPRLRTMRRDRITKRKFWIFMFSSHSIYLMILLPHQEPANVYDIKIISGTWSLWKTLLSMWKRQKVPELSKHICRWVCYHQTFLMFPKLFSLLEMSKTFAFHFFTWSKWMELVYQRILVLTITWNSLCQVGLVCMETIGIIWRWFVKSNELCYY